MSRHEIESEVTGLVFRLVAEVGDSVDAEAPVILLESMKMEIPALAPVAGRVAELRVAEGDAVEEGQVLAVIEA